MNTAELAQTLLASPSLVAAPTLRKQLGPDAYADAFKRGWLIPEHDTGLVQISPRLDRREAMKAEAAKAEKSAPVITESGTVPARTFFGEASNVVQLNTVAAAPGAATPQAPAPSGAQDKPAAVGDQVTVSEGGQTFQARVSTVAPDGKLKLSFGAGQRPARDTFGPSEVRITGRAAPAPTSPVSPVAR